MVAVDISFPGKHMAILKVTGLTPPPSSSEPTHTVHLFAASWLKAGGDYVEMGSSRLLMGERPFNTSLRLHPSCCHQMDERVKFTVRSFKFGLQKTIVQWGSCCGADPKRRHECLHERLHERQLRAPARSPAAARAARGPGNTRESRWRNLDLAGHSGDHTCKRQPGHRYGAGALQTERDKAVCTEGCAGREALPARAGTVVSTRQKALASVRSTRTTSDAAAQIGTRWEDAAGCDLLLHRYCMAAVNTAVGGVPR